MDSTSSSRHMIPVCEQGIWGLPLGWQLPLVSPGLRILALSFEELGAPSATSMANGDESGT